MAQVTTVRQGLAFFAVSVVLLAYCVYGAATEHLWVPFKHDVYLSGVSAWVLTAGCAAWVAASAMLVQQLRGAAVAWMPRIAIILIWVGVVSLAVCRFLPGASST